MYPRPVRIDALAALSGGESLSAVSRRTGIERSTLRAWRCQGIASRLGAECFQCDGTAPPPPHSYAALLGFYLGDGCISRVGRSMTLRVSCDRTYPGIVEDVSRLIMEVRPDASCQHVPARGVVVVQSYWKHWPCLFPQHGPGRKHERELTLEPWQQAIVDEHPGPFLRGLFHSDGCRSANFTTRVVAGERKRYDYPRWQFVNESEDIRGWCTQALDLLDVPWRRSGPRTISVSTRAGVAVLDEVVGPKS